MIIITKDHALNKYLIKHGHVAQRNDGNDAMNNLVLFSIATCTDEQVKAICEPACDVLGLWVDWCFDVVECA